MMHNLKQGWRLCLKSVYFAHNRHKSIKTRSLCQIIGNKISIKSYFSKFIAIYNLKVLTLLQSIAASASRMSENRKSERNRRSFDSSPFRPT